MLDLQHWWLFRITFSVYKNLNACDFKVIGHPFVYKKHIFLLRPEALGSNLCQDLIFHHLLHFDLFTGHCRCCLCEIKGTSYSYQSERLGGRSFIQCPVTSFLFNSGKFRSAKRQDFLKLSVRTFNQRKNDPFHWNFWKIRNYHDRCVAVKQKLLYCTMILQKVFLCIQIYMDVFRVPWLLFYPFPVWAI